MMMGLTLYQPWATLMAVEAKRNETRPRKLSYMGDLAICAGQLKFKRALPDYMDPALKWLWVYRRSIPSYNADAHANVFDLYKSLPFGKVVCVVEKYGCLSTEADNFILERQQEIDCGDYSDGRYFYPTRNCRPLREPIAIKGSQGLFNIREDLEAMIRQQL